MSKRDWYRRTTWSEEEASDFERRLARARSRRSDCLRIQAVTLAEQGDPRLSDAAIGLGRRYLDENPDGAFAASVLLVIAKAHATKGDTGAALDAYREAVRVERETAGIRCNAYLEFAWFVVARELAELYDEVIEAMASGEKSTLVYPVSRYRYFGALAFISDAQGDRAYASRMASNALEAAREHLGPFSRHPTVGVVERVDKRIQQKLEALAG